MRDVVDLVRQDCTDLALVHLFYSVHKQRVVHRYVKFSTRLFQGLNSIASDCLDLNIMIPLYPKPYHPVRTSTLRDFSNDGLSAGDPKRAVHFKPILGNMIGWKPPVAI